MATVNGTELSKSALGVEDAFIEVRTLVQSYVDVAGETLPPLLFTLERALDRFEAILLAHVEGINKGAL